jgi:predicted dinucleotide-binding enzyme
VKIVTIGKGKVGGGLADLWRKAGHQVTELGREGGDATGAEAALLAVPAAAISAALAGIRGLDGVPVIDSTNVVRDPRPEGFDSLAQYVNPVYVGDLPTARHVEDFIGLNFAIAAQRGPFFYRIAGPGDQR